ncbi:GAF domain-containing protein [Massilia forsythiae]|uniref:GAF domain-containing protein n=1 Tax=Massilia forsythiae TaxID=2728020 RepID=A0A7Z2VWC4_9BURK|nr:GAF domain-containing protein [Massilia forsythiae]
MSSSSDNTDDPVLTTAAAARLLGVAVSTTQLWLESGALPSWKTPGGHRRVRHSAVMKLLKERGGPVRPVAHAAPAAAVQTAAPVSAPGAAKPADFIPAPQPAYPIPLDERARLAALEASRLLDTQPDNVFDRLTRLAVQVTECPIALVTLLTAQRQWFKSGVGLDIGETPRGWAFCNHAILQDGPFIVTDAGQDPRFRANPLVVGAPHVRFYGGIPLRDAGGHALGALCVMDREPRRLRERELQALQELAAIATDELRRRT